MAKVFNKLRNLDAYPKVNEDFHSRTLSGGVITLASSIVITLLFLSEFNSSSQTRNASGGDLQEEIYQKIKSMNEMYFPEMSEIYQRMAAKLQLDN